MTVPDSTETAAALNSGAIHLLRAMAPVDARSGLTPARLSALSVLVFAGPKSLGALARIEGVAAATMTRIVDGLVEQELVERRMDPADRRAVRLSASPRGRALMLAARRRRMSSIALAIGALSSADRRALARAAGLLEQVAHNVAVPPGAKPGPAGPRRRRVSARGSR